MGKPKPKAARSPVDGLTPLERRIVKAAIENPLATNDQMLFLANVGGATKKNRLLTLKMTLRKRTVIDAIKNPPETVTGKVAPEKELDLTDPNSVRDWLLKKYRGIVDNKASPQNARIQALNDIKELVLGKSPQTVKLTGEIRSIADVVAAARQAAELAQRDSDPETKH